MPFCGTVGQIVKTERNGNEKLSIEWEIRRFSFLFLDFGDWFESPLFSFSNSCWVFGVYPNGRRRSGFVNLFIKKKDCIGPSGNIYLTFAIKGSNGVEMKVETQWEFSNGDDPQFWCQICSRSELMKRKSTLFPDDTLIITCDLATDVPRTSSDASIQTEQVVYPEVQASNEGIKEWQKSLLDLLETGKESDIVIRIRDKEFSAHRILLQARSTVFDAMFSHTMIESQNGVVTLEDCDPDTFPDFLKYIYTGSTEMISARNVCSLYCASDKYDLKLLKDQCTHFMKMNMTVSSFCESITVAVKYDEKELIKLAKAFFCAKTLDIVKTVKWRNFLVENPMIGNELFILSYSRKKREERVGRNRKSRKYRKK